MHSLLNVVTAPRRRAQLAACGLAIALLGSPANAADRLSPDELTPGLLTGSLFRELARHGVALQASTTLDALTNTRGGRARGAAPALLTEIRAGFDLARLADLPG